MGLKPDANASKRSPSLSTHPEYYLRGGDLYFLCDRVLFRVHSHFFVRESYFWRQQLLGPGSTQESPLVRGTSPDGAIVLSQKPEDFELLLWVIYNNDYGNYSKATLENWITILNFSTKWDFPTIKALAIRYLEGCEMDPIARIGLYQENQVPEKYLFRLYMQVACRSEVLSIEESRSLGLETLVLIHQARERLRAQPSVDKPLLSPINTNIGHASIIEIVSSTFGLSLNDVSPNQGFDFGPKTSGSGGPASGGSSSEGTEAKKKKVTKN